MIFLSGTQDLGIACTGLSQASVHDSSYLSETRYMSHDPSWVLLQIGAGCVAANTAKTGPIGRNRRDWTVVCSRIKRQKNACAGKYSLPLTALNTKRQWHVARGNKYSWNKVSKLDNTITDDSWKTCRKKHHPKINLYRMMINQLQPKDQISCSLKNLIKL